jgi:hypothetical protein
MQVQAMMQEATAAAEGEVARESEQAIVAEAAKAAAQPAGQNGGG